MKRLARLLGVLATALMLPFISAPVNLHWLHWVAFLPLFWALRDLPLKSAIRWAYLCGWVANLVIFWWLIETVQRFSNLPWLAALAVHLLATTAFSLSYGLLGLMPWSRQRLGRLWMLALPLAVVAGEQAFPVLFPYYQGVSQYRVSWVFQLASVTGVMGVSFLIMLVNSVLAELSFDLAARRRPPWAALAATSALFMANLGFGAWRHATIHAELQQAPLLRAAILQQGVKMEQRLSESPWEAFFEWTRLTRLALDDKPDLVVWPEGAIAFNPIEPGTFAQLRESQLRRLLDRLIEIRGNNLMSWPDDAGTMSPRNPKLVEALAQKSIANVFEDYAHIGGFDLLIGGGTIEDNPHPGPGEPDYIAHNSLYVFDEQGTIEGRYDKMVPLPFGEYIPLSHTFPWLRELVQGPGDFQAGDHPAFFSVKTAQGQDLIYTTPICYEAILQPTMRRLAGGDTPQTTADFFVNITNDAWFGDTASPHQHAMLTAVQTLQLGRPELRLAYTGVSWVVEPDGDILYETEPFTTVAEVVDMRVKRYHTIYSRGGWLFGWLCVAGTVGMVVLGRHRGTAAPPVSPAAA